MYIKPFTSGKRKPVSGIFVAILIGIIIRNTIGLHRIFIGALKFSLKYALRTGIILLGLRLVSRRPKIRGLGTSAHCRVYFMRTNRYTLFYEKKGQSSRLGTLIACGTGICGVTAIMATAPVVKAKDNEVSYAVANITIFG